jgi:hypothetical protein
MNDPLDLFAPLDTSHAPHDLRQREITDENEQNVSSDDIRKEEENSMKLLTNQEMMNTSKQRGKRSFDHVNDDDSVQNQAREKMVSLNNRTYKIHDYYIKAHSMNRTNRGLYVIAVLVRMMSNSTYMSRVVIFYVLSLVDIFMIRNIIYGRKQ